MSAPPAVAPRETLPPRTPAVAAPRGAVAVAAAGCGLLAGRPLLVEVARPAPVLIALFGGLLMVSLAWPGRRASVRQPVGALALGIAAFAVGRLLSAGAAVPAATAFAVGINTLAAVAEEAFFRRLVYGALLAGGPGVAVVGSALLFAAVHVSVYGLWVLPIDLAAGLLLSWQRQATGSWTVPALTHAVANLLVVL
ncbi:MAG TPA: CPBP family intramembrane glutamic endopeptidase [Acidimicrobiia bacterium]|nr:CPBP family intramembrane glutamic endopeptidase [Acidimicrobiia bacterium]